MSGAVDSILGLTSTQFVARSEDFGVVRREALGYYRQAFREGTLGDRPVRAWPVVKSQIDGETTKFIQRHDDGYETESVLIPMLHRTGRFSVTLCVSSQVGCAMGCRFCETAQMGFIKNLAPGEIVGQWFAAVHELKRPVKNIVFMGMGEPMENLDHVMQAIRVLVDHNGPAIAVSNITVSTVGRVEGIQRLSEFIREPGHRGLNLAVSINAPNDEIRSSIMPINRSSPLAELRDALLAWPKRRSAAICAEYVLIPGVNDADEHCDEVCDYLKPLRCSLNVIPYNPRRDSPWPAPDEAAVTRFVNRAVANGQFTKRRMTKGRSAMAACGQLGNEHIRGRRHVITVSGRPTGEIA